MWSCSLLVGMSEIYTITCDLKSLALLTLMCGRFFQCMGLWKGKSCQTFTWASSPPLFLPLFSFLLLFHLYNQPTFLSLKKMGISWLRMCSCLTVINHSSLDHQRKMKNMQREAFHSILHLFTQYLSVLRRMLKTSLTAV